MSNPQKRMVKQTLIESQLNGTGISKNQEVLERLQQETGYNWRLPDKEYPLETMQAISSFLIKEYIKTGKTLQQSFYQVGADLATGFRGTIIGRVGFGAAHLMKPLKLMERMTEAINRHTNYGNRTCEQVSANHIRVIMQDEPANPEWLKGMFETALGASSLTNFRVDVKVLGQEQHRINITWV
jgi:uncharacterized protein (TIGR02265 family)